MDLKHIVVLALQVSIFCTVFGFGLKTTTDDLMYLIRRPGLLLRSLLGLSAYAVRNSHKKPLETMHATT